MDKYLPDTFPIKRGLQHGEPSLRLLGDLAF
jgi:hypothetical protein